MPAKTYPHYDLNERVSDGISLRWHYPNQAASQVSGLAVGDPLSLEGRVQSRIYRKMTEIGPEERVAYEVSVMRLLETPQS